MVTKEMIGAAHDICLKKGDFVLSANLLERIYLAMRDKAGDRDSAGWDAYEDLRKVSDEMVLELRQRVAELEMERDELLRAFNQPVVESEWQKLTAERDDLMKAAELYEQALLASWPEGAMGNAFDYRNQARILIANIKDRG